MMDFDDGLGGIGGLGGGFGGAFGQRAAEPMRVPVSILCGFLGAGKTTLVQHILQNREGMKVGIVVNDVAEVNVDSAVLQFEDADGIVGLQNGCACCSGRDDLFARLQELVEGTGIAKVDKPWDRLVVECSGVAEPESIAEELKAMGIRNEPLMRRIFLAGIICVIDASTFWDMYHSDDSGSDERKPLSALLVSQIESSDTVIINKSDLVSQADLDRLSELLAALNPSARRIVTSHGAQPLRTLLPADPVDLDMPAYVPTLANRHSVAVRTAERQAAKRAPAARAAADHGHGHAAASDHGHGHAHDHGHAHAEDCSICAASAATQHEQYGLSVFVYRCAELFHAMPLAALAQQLPVARANVAFAADASVTPSPSKAFDGVLRSKGFVRLAVEEGSGKVPEGHYWSHAGRQLDITPVKSAPGRGQELVFIGIGMDEKSIVQALDKCVEDPGSDAKL